MGEHLPPINVERVAGPLRSSPIGHYIRYLPSVDSTNLAARQLSLTHGEVIITDYQVAGRGRRGRAWEAPPNTSLLLSVMLQAPNILPGDVVTAVGLAVADAVHGETGVPVDLKWPNDILVRGRKLCGILAEHDPGSGGIVAGIGLNVNFDPDPSHPLTANATSLRRELGRTVDREALAVALFTRLNLWYRMLTERADVVHEAWVARLAIIGKSLEVHDSSGTWSGTAFAIQRDGALGVRDDGEEVRTLYAADVSIRSTELGQVHVADREVD